MPRAVFGAGAPGGAGRACGVEAGFDRGRREHEVLMPEVGGKVVRRDVALELGFELFFCEADGAAVQPFGG